MANGKLDKETIEKMIKDLPAKEPFRNSIHDYYDYGNNLSQLRQEVMLDAKRQSYWGQYTKPRLEQEDLSYWLDGSTSTATTATAQKENEFPKEKLDKAIKMVKEIVDQQQNIKNEQMFRNFGRVTHFDLTSISAITKTTEEKKETDEERYDRVMKNFRKKK